MEISIIIEIYDRNNTTQIEDTLYLVLQTIPSENTEKFENKAVVLANSINGWDDWMKLLKFAILN